jgi:hypothetical protein
MPKPTSALWRSPERRSEVHREGEAPAEPQWHQLGRSLALPVNCHAFLCQSLTSLRKIQQIREPFENHGFQFSKFRFVESSIINQFLSHAARHLKNT